MLWLLLSLGSATLNPLPLYSLTTASSWPEVEKDGLHYGDIRAVVNVTVPAPAVRVQIFWRRRDPSPEVKGVLVRDPSGKATGVSDVTVQAGCGVMTLDAPQPGVYHVYYLAHYSTGGDAHLHFHWYGCEGHGRPCVTGALPPPSARARQDDACASILQPLGGEAHVVGLENRPNAEGIHDHAPSGEPFNGFTALELTALPAEEAAFLAAQPAGTLLLFMEERKRAVRNFAQAPATWMRSAGPVLELSDEAWVGEHFTFQIGVFAGTGAVPNITVAFSPLVSAAHTIPASALGCINLGGVQPDGSRFVKEYGVAAGKVGALWVGVALPPDLNVAGTFEGKVVVSAPGYKDATCRLNLAVKVPSSGQPVPFAGAGDVYSMARLAWLDSTLGLDDNVTEGFAPVHAGAVAGGRLKVTLVNKDVIVGANGLLEGADVVTVKVRKGAQTTVHHSPLAAPVTFEVFGPDMAPLPVVLTSSTHVTSRTPSGVGWMASWEAGSAARVDMRGSLEYDSYVEMSATIMNAGSSAVSLGDVRLRVPGAAPSHVVGWGQPAGAPPHAYTWRWDTTVGSNCGWSGRTEAGVFVKLKGPGKAWDSPMYSKDEIVIPFIPRSWGGAAAAEHQYGVNVSAGGMLTAFSGPRTLAPGASVVFLWDMILTPAKQLDLQPLYRERYLQVGYGLAYTTPAEAKAQGATVVTLHQGISGLVNGSFVNPYINYPFIPDTVELMENYTQQAHALDLSVKFYYTIRELSNHAVETYALKALQGEVYWGNDTYIIPQKGYCQDWDCHGGAIYLHEHLVHDYVFCWQQTLSNGDWDAAICNNGVGRWFNYYAMGAYWSVQQAPHMDGIYYDGINFDRRSFRRIRKLLDRASKGKASRPQVDLHTGFGNNNAPTVMAYLSHYPYADLLWNGEGFNFNEGPDYWLINYAAFFAGKKPDRLGGSGLDHKGLMFASYQRNSAAAPGIWSFWDKYHIDNSTLIGWWEDDMPVSVVAQRASSCKYDSTSGHYWEACGGSDANIGFGAGCGPGHEPSYSALTVDEAKDICCQLAEANKTCAGFSIMSKTDAQGRADGCFKTNVNCGTVINQAFNGYRLEEEDCVRAAVFVTYTTRAIVVLASWCSEERAVQLKVDYGALGLAEGSATGAIPDIAHVQSAGLPPHHPEGPYSVPGGKGLVVVLSA